MSIYTPPDLLLHRGSMLLLNDIIAADTETAEARVEITSASSFFQTDLGVPTWIGLEYMAQTVGLTAGILGKEQGDGVPLGYLLGTRKYQCNQLWFPERAELKISSKEELYDGTLGVFSCTIESLNLEKPITASARLTVYKAGVQEILSE